MYNPAVRLMSENVTTVQDDVLYLQVLRASTNATAASNLAVLSSIDRITGITVTPAKLPTAETDYTSCVDANDTAFPAPPSLILTFQIPAVSKIPAFSAIAAKVGEVFLDSNILYVNLKDQTLTATSDLRAVCVAYATSTAYKKGVVVFDGTDFYYVGANGTSSGSTVGASGNAALQFRKIKVSSGAVFAHTSPGGSNVCSVIATVTGTMLPGR